MGRAYTQNERKDFKLGNLQILFSDDPVDGWHTIVNTNLLGLCMCNKYAVQCMMARGVDDGHIININRYFLHSTAVFFHIEFLPSFIYSSLIVIIVIIN